MYAWSSYVPRLVRRRLAFGQFEASPTLEGEDAAVLCADIEGSTAIVERGVALGAAGLERLSASLNQVFCNVIDEVYSSGGDVLFTTGDGFLAYWPTTSTRTLSEAAELATIAALNVQVRAESHDNGLSRHQPAKKVNRPSLTLRL